MPMMTIRNIPDEVHRALRARAHRHERSAEAEVREILAAAVLPNGHRRLSDALAALGREVGLTNEDVEALQATRDRTPAKPMEFE